jgi:anti-sigma regulatory factor (Ser/Thr protein kinase)
MAVMVTRASDAAEELATMAGAAVLGSLAIPGRPEHVRQARAFAARVLAGLGPAAETAVLLTSELVTNAVRHSRSRAPGGTVTLVILEDRDGVRIEVTDEGSDTGVPVVKADTFASDGHGLMLVQSLAEQWGYLRSGAVGTTVWFQLARPAANPPAARLPAARLPGEPRDSRRG